MLFPFSEAGDQAAQTKLIEAAMRWCEKSWFLTRGGVMMALEDRYAHDAVTIDKAAYAAFQQLAEFSSGLTTKIAKKLANEQRRSVYERDGHSDSARGMDLQFIPSSPDEKDLQRGAEKRSREPADQPTSSKK